jgi:hypothetical protein
MVGLPPRTISEKYSRARVQSGSRSDADRGALGINPDDNALYPSFPNESNVVAEARFDTSNRQTKARDALSWLGNALNALDALLLVEMLLGPKS